MIRQGIVVCLLALLAFAGCSDQERREKEVSAQETKVESARKSLKKADARLAQMRDSLQTKIKASIALGMAADEAKKLEEALVESQRTVVDAEQKNLKLKEEYLGLLRLQLEQLE